MTGNALMDDFATDYLIGKPGPLQVVKRAGSSPARMSLN